MNGQGVYTWPDGRRYEYWDSWVISHRILFSFIVE